MVKLMMTKLSACFNLIDCTLVVLLLLIVVSSYLLSNAS